MRLHHMCRHLIGFFFGLMILLSACGPRSQNTNVESGSRDTLPGAAPSEVSAGDSGTAEITHPSAPPFDSGDSATHNDVQGHPAHEMQDDIAAKFDAPLRQALAREGGTALQVLIELPAAPSDSQRSALERAGLDRHSVVGRIVTATGSPDAIRRVASFDFVRSLSLSRERPPLD